MNCAVVGGICLIVGAWIGVFIVALTSIDSHAEEERYKATQSAEEVKDRENR